MTLRLWEGPSEINGEPILCSVGALDGSRNLKTGHMLQQGATALGHDPHEAVKNGADSAVCGSCAMRPSALRCVECDAPVAKSDAFCRACGTKKVRCYVLLFRGMLNQHRAALLRPIDLDGGLARMRRIDRPIRLGEYGNPSSMPLWLVVKLVQSTGRWTAYEHQWSQSDAEFERCKPYLRYAMASANNLAEAKRAWAAGYRTFRVLRHGEAPQPNETMCPFYTRRGVRCETCLLCNGTRLGDKRRSIVGPALNAGGRKQKTTTAKPGYTTQTVKHLTATQETT